jgi:hypothetical protein
VPSMENIRVNQMQSLPLRNLESGQFPDNMQLITIQKSLIRSWLFNLWQYFLPSEDLVKTIEGQRHKLTYLQQENERMLVNSIVFIINLLIC